jgi:hypothetical protein
VWPPSWSEPAPGDYPPSRWPSKEQLTYTKELVTVALLLLALPWLLSKLLTDPGALFAGLGKRHVGRAVTGG